MKMSSSKLIAELTDTTKQHIVYAEQLMLKPDPELTWKENARSWNILECLEHLNLYGDYYLPEIERAIMHSQYGPVTEFKSGALGNYFANMMLPKEKLNKMKTMKNKNPINTNLNRQTIARFTDQLKQMIVLLGKAKNVNLSKTKTGMSITNLIQLRLGDTLRVVINHNARHIQQVKRIEDKFQQA